MSTGQDDQGFHERAQELFLRALEQPADRRDRWLDEACAGDRALRDEVGSLLRHHSPRQPLVEETGGPARLLVVRDLSAPTWTRPRAVLLAVLVLLLGLGVGGVVVQLQVRSALRKGLEDQLVGMRDSGVTGLKVWLDGVVVDTQEIADDPAVAAAVVALSKAGGDGEAPPDEAALRARLDDFCARRHWLRWAAVRLSDAQVVATGGPGRPAPETVGRTLTVGARRELALVAEQGSRVIPPHPSGVYLEGDPGAGPPVMSVGASVHDGGKPVAVLAFQIPPDNAFTLILSMTSEKLGETVAFNREGRLLSHSVYEDALRAAGWLSGPTAMLALEMRDPGVDLLAGGKPAEPLAACPGTEAFRHAVAGPPAAQVETPYRSYAGQKVFGAWTWLKDYDFGVVSEIPVEQADAPLVPWRRVLVALWVLLGVVALAIVALSLAIRRLRERVEQVAELWQYRLDRSLGAGGMGAVYLARHALLRRPTALKVLAPAKATAELVQRFEQEVQHTAELTHPNTIEIYDYGRTPERVFYYAMEYADGLTLARLVELEGRLPPGRVVHLLRQLCGSLAEAHARGLVHRDVKPQNVIVCERGGVPDFVKVLDFGLVKESEPPPTAPAEPATPFAQQTAPDLLLGTLLYLPPERLRGDTTAHPRVDVYAVGATAFRMLTGRDVFTGATTAELCANILSQPVPRLATLGVLDTPRSLEALMRTCLSKDPALRPADAGELLATLENVASLDGWNLAQARAWWQRHRAGSPAAGTAG